jgi:DNA polymerase-3 subunit gamma/tau
MSIALYRKYRPKTFGEVTNQNHIKITLQNELMHNHLAHAYLLCGPRGTGKTTLARLLAKSANCLDLQPGGEPCNACESCQNIMLGKAMDIIEIDAASHTGVDNVRENIINNARFTPTNSKYKVFIIDEVHMLSTASFNALLKIMEEPPAHVIFVLATTEIQKVPVTIISRCQRFDFKKIIFSELVDRLRWITVQEQVSVSEPVLERIARSAGGCVRDAESLLEQVLSLGDKTIDLPQVELIIPRSNFESYFQLLKYILEKNTKAAIELVNVLVEEGNELPFYVNQFIDFIRRAMLFKITGSNLELLRDLNDRMAESVIDLTKESTAASLARIIDVLMKTKELFRSSHIAQLPLEVAIIELTQGGIYNREVNNAPPVRPVAPSPAIPAEEVKKKSSDVPVSSMSVLSETSVIESDVKNDVVVTETTVVVETVVDTSNSEPQEVVRAGNGLSLTYAQVLSRWPIVKKTITEKSYPLGMSLSVAKPTKLEGRTIHLGFLFPLQRDRVDASINLGIIGEVLKAEFGADLEIKTYVDGTLKLADITNDSSVGQEPIQVEQEQVEKDPVGQVLDVFGGIVVDKV